MEAGFLYSKEQSEFFNAVAARFKPKKKPKKPKEKRTRKQRQLAIDPQPPRDRVDEAQSPFAQIFGADFVPVMARRRSTARSEPSVQRLPTPPPPPSPRTPVRPLRPELPSEILLALSNKGKVAADQHPEAPRTRKYRMNGMTITIEKDAPSDRDGDESPLLPPGAPRPGMTSRNREDSIDSAEFRDVLASVGWKADGDQSIAKSWTDWVDSVNTGARVSKRISWQEPWIQDVVDVDEIERWLDSFGFRGDDVQDSREWI